MKNEWLPIETAPRDESMILVFIWLEGRGEKRIAYYENIHDAWYDSDMNRIKPTDWMDTGPDPVRRIKKDVLENY